MSQKEKKRTFDLSSGNNFNSISSNNLNKVFPGITLPKENKSLFSVSQSIYTHQEYEELINIDIKQQQNVFDISNRTRYTISATIDEIKKVLASVRSNKDIDDREYYFQAYQFQKLGLYKREDVPVFKVKLNHLPSDIIYELSTFDTNTRRFVLKQAVSRIFEDINFDLYHDSISSRLEVSLIE